MGRKYLNLGTVGENSIRRYLISDYFERNMHSKGASILDLGCGRRPYQEIYDSYFDRSIGFDIPTTQYDIEKVDVFGYAHDLPFEDETFDAVLCTEVLEHTEKPVLVLRETNRVLKKNGILILTTPFMVPIHDAPDDYYRFTPYALNKLLDASGFEVLETMNIGELFYVSFSFVNQVHLKVWHYVSEKTGMSFLYDLWNPFIFLFSFAPQKLYAALVKRYALRCTGKIRETYKYLGYSSKGFFMSCRKLT